MARALQDATEAELAVLQVLWDKGPAAIRQITDLLYPRGQTSHYATVQKLLERLEAKEFVARDRSGNVNVYSALVNRDELIGRRLQAMAEELCGGSLTPLLMNLVQAQKLTPAERQTLRELIEELDRKKNKRG